MGLFSRRKAAVAEAVIWEPVWDEPGEVAGDDADMDDSGQSFDVGYRAYMVAFRNDEAPDALITAWTYVSYGSSPEGAAKYCLRVAFQYSAGSDENWTFSGYADDPLEEIFNDPSEAEDQAETWAAVLAAGNPASMGNLPTVFEWDGEPFPVGDPG